MPKLSVLTNFLPTSQAGKDMATLMDVWARMRQLTIHANPRASEEVIKSKTCQMMNLYLDI